MSKESVAKTFTASIDYLSLMLQFVRSQSKKAGLKEELVGKVELALEEALVNVIKHGFVGLTPGAITIDCYSLDQQGVVITITDNGIPYNPLLSPPKKDLSKITEEELSGGYGIYLITRIMDEISYEYKNGCNCLILTKYCNL